MFQTARPLYNKMFEMNSTTPAQFADFYNKIKPAGGVVLVPKHKYLDPKYYGTIHEEYGHSIYWLLFAFGTHFIKDEIRAIESINANLNFNYHTFLNRSTSIMDDFMHDSNEKRYTIVHDLNIILNLKIIGLGMG